MNYQLYFAKKASMDKTAIIFGIAAIFLGVSYMPFFSIPLGCFSIVFASLAKGYEKKLSKQQIVAISTGIIALFLSVATVVLAVRSFYTNEEYRNNVTSMIEQLYGDTYEEIYGEDISSLWSNFIPEGSK